MTGFIEIEQVHDLLSIFAIRRKYIRSMDGAKDFLQKEFTMNIQIFKVSVMPDFNYLIFESEDVLKNWLYYAGLEYADAPHMIRYEGSFLAWWHYDDHDRIKDILDKLEALEKLEEDDDTE